MKIAVIASYFPSLLRFRLDMMKEFIRHGHEVVAVAEVPPGEAARPMEDAGIRYCQVAQQRNGINPLADIRSFFAMRRLLKAEKPDKIFVFQAKAIVYASLAAYSLGIKEVYPLIAGAGSVFLGRGMKAALVRFVLTTEYKLALRKAPRVFFQNRDDAELFREHGIVGSSKVVYMNGSGVNLENFTVQPFPERFGFLCVSRLIRDKGVGEYLEACRAVKKACPDVRCLLVGPFDTNPSAVKPAELREYIDDGSIEYFGEQDDVRPSLAQCTVFVLPSYREGTPKAVLEAMACGKAIITTDAPGCRETVTDGLNGRLVPVKDVDTLAAAMMELSHNPELCAEMGRAGRRITEERFDVKLVNKTVLETMGLSAASE